MPRQLTPMLKPGAEPQFADAWERQLRTAADILQRLDQQEGVILADQVGMGKTYVALCVAVSEILATEPRGQVVVMVPSAVARKWVDEWQKFATMCLAPHHGITCVKDPIRTSTGFLKALDDDPTDATNLLIVTHSALTNSMRDPFIQLALLHLATKHRRELLDMRRYIAKWCTGRGGLIKDSRFTPERVDALLAASPTQWLTLWHKVTGELLDDDPVPAALIDTYQHVDLDPLRDAILELPKKRTDSIGRRLKHARAELDRATQDVWKSVLSAMSMELPLLIVDEAHRLKNGRTNVAGLFAVSEEDSAGNLSAPGGLSGIFERMLFLTATPFELGHRELTNVLARLRAVRRRPGSAPLSIDSARGVLAATMDAAQHSALALDKAWAQLKPEDQAAFDSWRPDSAPHAGIGAAAASAWRTACDAVASRERMNAALRPWIIRHERAHRRQYLPGAAVELGSHGAAEGGLAIPQDLMLPFLLAARAQFVANSDESSTARPYFAYGIASSFQAFLRSAGGSPAREQPDLSDADDWAEDDETASGEVIDDAGLDVPELDVPALEDESSWYRREIITLLTENRLGPDSHPKVRATADRAVDLWLDGRKCLIFFWYIRTGEALEEALAEKIDDAISAIASTALDLPVEEALIVVSQISDRLFRTPGRSGEEFRDRLRAHLATCLAPVSGDPTALLDSLVEATVRTLRSPAYLVRHTRLSADMDIEGLWRGLGGDNPGGLNYLERLEEFTRRAYAMEESERGSVFDALLGEHQDARSAGRGASLRQVRRAHGATNRSTRERLTRVFNTPFAPDILVASSVMGEGIDLHQECRDVIHHDLDWNPSVLEQRTGRLDRIGSLAERREEKIDVYEPYLAGTHDEKMFKVVKDRAGWFEIVMGRAGGHSEVDTDREESRVPLAPQIAEALTMDLESPR